MAGFGFTERVEGYEYTMENWVQHAIDLMDALDIEKTHLVGNSLFPAPRQRWVEALASNPEDVKKKFNMKLCNSWP